MIIGIQDEILRINSLGLLDRLLADKTTKANILWATDAYSDMGSDYQRDKEIKAPLITGEHSGIIKNRARKALEQQFERTRQHAEVFTPLWVCAKMNDYADEVWFGRPEVFTKDGEPTERVDFPKGKSWQRYVDSRRLEITCGEAPYLVSRYDVSTGESIPIERRLGLLDRKLRVVNENVATEDEWLKWTLRAFQSTYGYEFQGDNVLISRVNLLTTFEEYLTARWKRKPTKKEYEKITNIIAWNLWQMDGLTSALPYCKAEDEYRQLSIFDWLGMNENVDAANIQPRCRIMNWLGGRSVEFINLPIRGNHGMKFDFIIGNPPYQEEDGGASASAKPVYQYFVDGASRVSEAYCLIMPSRWYSGGKGLDDFRNTMLKDIHIKALHDFPNTNDMFPNVNIRGGVCIVQWDSRYNNSLDGTKVVVHEGKNEHVSIRPLKYKDIDIFIRNFQAIAVLEKAKTDSEQDNMAQHVSPRRPFGIGSDFSRSDAFHKESTDLKQPVACVGKRRQVGYVEYDDVVAHREWINVWKVFVPRANNIGTELNDDNLNSFVGEPGVICTEAYIVVGMDLNLDKWSAKALEKFLQTRFARFLHSVAKASQDASSKTYRFIPTQDFTPASDIDWSKSIPEIDQQLYAKYGLDESEIAFIESHVKEMK